MRTRHVRADSLVGEEAGRSAFATERSRSGRIDRRSHRRLALLGGCGGNGGAGGEGGNGRGPCGGALVVRMVPSGDSGPVGMNAASGNSLVANMNLQLLIKKVKEYPLNTAQQ